MTPHPRLGYVVNSKLPEIDAAGFRNSETTLDDAEIVVIGDSHTYGYNVEAAQDFPSQLAEMTGRRVYNLGVGSYGIYHYTVLINELPARAGMDVLLALYPANDLVGHCSTTSLPHWQTLSKELGITLPSCEETADTSEASMPTESQSFSDWAKAHSALLGWFDYSIWDRIKPRTVADDFPAFELPEGQRLAIALASDHDRGTDLRNPDIQLSYENSLILIRQLKEKLHAAGAELSILMIPSRTRVLREWARRESILVAAEFDALALNENTLTSKYAEAFRADGTRHLDAIDAVVSALSTSIDKQEVFYPDNEDGHPYEQGYAAYAAAAVQLLKK